MTFDGAVQLTAAMTGCAFVQQSLEHLHPAARAAERRLFAPRLALSLALFGAAVAAPQWLPVVTLALVANHLLILPFFNGPYNGGADRMSLLLLVCLTGRSRCRSPGGGRSRSAISRYRCCSAISSPAGSRW